MPALGSQQARNVVSTLKVDWILDAALNNYNSMLFPRGDFNVEIPTFHQH
jgi:hypothetical protein